jgi:hypothetical protein
VGVTDEAAVVVAIGGAAKTDVAKKTATMGAGATRRMGALVTLKQALMCRGSC